MEQLHIYVKGQLLAAEAELVGMSTANIAAQIKNEPLVYSEEDFIKKAQEIHNITNQLFR